LKLEKVNARGREVDVRVMCPDVRAHKEVNRSTFSVTSAPTLAGRPRSQSAWIELACKMQYAIDQEKNKRHLFQMGAWVEILRTIPQERMDQIGSKATRGLKYKGPCDVSHGLMFAPRIGRVD